MKLLIIFLLVIFSLLLASCQPEDIPPLLDEETEFTGMTNEEILEQFPDGLDEALQELEEIEDI